MKVETQLPLGKLDPGLRSAPKLDLASVPDGAREIERLGFDGFVTGEIKTDPFIPLALAATTTERISLTPAVAIAFPRSPTVTAMMSWDIQTLSRGRFILGLGTQVKGHIERRYGVTWAPPVPRLREYILALRALWDCWQNGTPLDVRGTHYNLSVMVPLFNPGPIAHPHIPIHIAAINTRMCQLAGETCDGIRPHPITTRKFMTEIMLPNVALGAARAGRKLESFEVAISPLVAVGEDAQELAARLRDVRARIAFYASTRTYRAVFEAHGWGSLVEELHALSVQKRWEEMPEHIADGVLETIAIVGTWDDVARKILERYGDFATRIEFSLPVRKPGDAERLRRVLGELQGAPAPRPPGR
jgi:probable F420-dependent oxidoreductase